MTVRRNARRLFPIKLLILKTKKRWEKVGKRQTVYFIEEGENSKELYFWSDSRDLLFYLSKNFYENNLRRTWRIHDECDFPNKSNEMLQFFKTRGYPDYIFNSGQHRAANRHRRKRMREFHSQLLSILQNDPETATIFSQPPLISQTQTRTIKLVVECLRARCKICLFSHNVDKISTWNRQFCHG